MLKMPPMTALQAWRSKYKNKKRGMIGRLFFCKIEYKNMNTVRSRYFNYMQLVVRQALENNTVENQEIADLAIRRYSASLDNDYKTMWEETERLMQKMLTDLERNEVEVARVRAMLSQEQLRARNLQREIARIERFHGVQR